MHLEYRNTYDRFVIMSWSFVIYFSQTIVFLSQLYLMVCVDIVAPSTN